MAGAMGLEMVEKATEKLLMTTTRETNPWKWKAQYARCFTYPTSYLSKITSADTITTTSATATATSPPSSLSPTKRSHFKRNWISSSGLATVSLHHSSDGSSAARSILTVTLQGIVMEEHFISKLQFVWPQVSCLSGFPTRGSLVVLVSYADSFDEKQKFAMRFSGVSEAQDFVTSLEDILSNRIPCDISAVDVSEISSQSEFIPPYRPDTSSMMTPNNNSIMPEIFPNEDQQDLQTQDELSDSQSNAFAYPPRFSSLVSSCSAEHEQGKLALALAPGPQDFDLKAQILKYMQDASFLDMVNKVNEVITELGDDFEI